MVSLLATEFFEEVRFQRALQLPKKHDFKQQIKLDSYS